MESFWKTDVAADVGVSLIPCYRVTRDSTDFPIPVWSSIVYGAHVLNKTALERLSKLNRTNYR